MERLSLRQRDALRALKTLDDILKERFSIIVRDTTIQRFEYTFEALWKFLREYLKEREGIVVRPAKAGVFSRSQSCQGKSQKLCSLDSRAAGNQSPEAYRQNHL